MVGYKFVTATSVPQAEVKIMIRHSTNPVQMGVLRSVGCTERLVNRYLNLASPAG